ncbi:MAG: ABC transporter ATP-binding protein, partial [Cellulosilyticaceae bacterium]
DAKLRVQMRTEISKLHQRLQTTFIYVTHDQVEAMTLGTRIVVLKDGVVQQVDSPARLYGEPENLFVAGFIGSPQMNFVETKVSSNGDEVTLAFGDATITLPKAKADSLVAGGYVGKEVMMGIRPEHIADMDTVNEYEKDKYEVVTSNVEVTEMLGSETFLYMVCQGHNMTGRVNPSCKAKPGSSIQIGLDTTKIHLFDLETQLTICN